MKRILSTMLCVLLLSTAVPFAASAEEVNTQTCNIDVPCLERDLPHGDALWEQIYALERQLPDLNGAESYSQIMDEVSLSERPGKSRRTVSRFRRAASAGTRSTAWLTAILPSFAPKLAATSLLTTQTNLPL